MAAQTYDSFLLVSFGGPDCPDDVAPFLKNVLGGRSIPEERLKKLAEPYMLLGGKSPINEQNRALLAAIVDELSGRTGRGGDLGLAVYLGNLHWRPTIADALAQMADDGCVRTLAFATSAYGSYPGCRQYRRAIEQARKQVGPAAPRVDKIRLFYNHPGFIEAAADRVAAAFGRIDESDRGKSKVIFTAHSLPVDLARECPYERQVRESCRLVVERLQAGEQIDDDAKRSLAGWEQVYQSRSGSPSQPWLGPDVGERLIALDECKSVLISPIGFMSDHKEVVFDVDVEVQALCDRLNIKMVRAGTVGTHPSFVRMIRELVEERLQENPIRKSLGPDGPWPDECPKGCCPGPQ